MTNETKKILAEAQVLAEKLPDAQAFIFAVAIGQQVKVLAGGELTMQSFLKLAIDGQMLKKLEAQNDS
jgi:hypothetical protein